MSTFFVFCAGASASGKTTFSKMLAEALTVKGVSTQIIPVDYYYKKRSEGLPELSNFDLPDSFDLDLLYQNVQDIRKQRPGSRLQLQSSSEFKYSVSELVSFFNKGPVQSEKIAIEAITGERPVAHLISRFGG